MVDKQYKTWHRRLGISAIKLPQVQASYDIHESPEQWGSERNKTGITPEKTAYPAPLGNPEIYFVQGKKVFGKACGCEKTGLK
ncbi:hypothetical protein JTB14_015866 [Gonioctena quinquepunctata]|nr:hypothetical protein JTB14_015866 [Gonioctena quinquepunctata]